MLKIETSQNYHRGWVELICYEIAGNGCTYFNFYTQVAKTISREDVSQGVPEEFVMKIPHPLFNELLKQFSELADQKGIKPDSDAVREGEIKATKFHLEDMRKLLKLTN